MLSLLAFMAIGAAVGAGAGAVSKAIERKQQHTNLSRQRAMARDAYKYQQQHADASFNLQRTEALEQLGIQRNRLAGAFGEDVSGFNMGLEGQALQNQQARVSLADGAGMAYAAQGAGGTRGSNTLQQQINFQETQFARQENLQGRGNALSMQTMTRQYSNSFEDIGREMNSWTTGYHSQAKSLGDVYAQQMRGLQVRGFEAAEADLNNPLYKALDYMGGTFGGAYQGAMLGSMVGGMAQQAPQGNAQANSPYFNMGGYTDSRAASGSTGMEAYYKAQANPRALAGSAGMKAYKAYMGIQ